MAERFVSLVRDQRAAVLGLLNDRPADHWAKSTARTGWTLHDVAAHLVENELLFGRLYRGELTAPTAEDLDAETGVERWRRADGETIRFSLWHHGSATQRVIDSRPDGSWARIVAVAGDDVPLRHLLRRHFFELAVHAYDIASALGEETPWGDRVGPLVEYCIRVAPSALTRAGVPASGPVAVRVPDVGAWTLTGQDDWAVGPDEPSAASAWTVDAETLVLATTERLSAAEAFDRSTVEGEAGAVAAVLAGWRATG